MNNLLHQAYLLAFQVPGITDPNPTPPTGFKNGSQNLADINSILNYLSWIAAVAAIFTVILIGIKIIVARGGNSPENAAKALGSLPWVAGGLILMLSATQLVGIIVK